MWISGRKFYRPDVWVDVASWLYLLGTRLLAANAMSQILMSSIDVHVTTLSRIGPKLGLEISIYSKMAKYLKYLSDHSTMELLKVVSIRFKVMTRIIYLDTTSGKKKKTQTIHLSRNSDQKEGNVFAQIYLDSVVPK